MQKIRKGTIPVLIDIKYKHSLNKFEEEYGEHIPYSEIEQKSYIELKSKIFKEIDANIKFKKHYRDRGILTLKADMLEKEYDKLIELERKKKFDFTHNFEICGIKILNTKL